VAFHVVRVLASWSAPWRRAARAVTPTEHRPQRRAAAPLPLLDASRLSGWKAPFLHRRPGGHRRSGPRAACRPGDEDRYRMLKGPSA